MKVSNLKEAISLKDKIDNIKHKLEIFNATHGYFSFKEKMKNTFIELGYGNGTERLKVLGNVEDWEFSLSIRNQIEEYYHKKLSQTIQDVEQLD